MRRRDVIAMLGGAAVVWSFTARAQHASLPVVGFLHSASPDPKSSYSAAVAALRQGLSEQGFIEGENVAIEYRWANDRFDQLPPLASDLVDRNVSVIFAGGGDVAALAAKTATTTIPIVFAIGADPIQHGIVKSLSRPGGNVTGATSLAVELRPKLLELMRELVPTATTIAVLGNPDRPAFETSLDEVLKPAQTMGLKTQVLKASNERELVQAFSILEHIHADGLLVLSDPVYFDHRDQLARLEMTYGVPAIYSSWREIVASGGLASYGANIEETYREAGTYVGRILKGERPADLPVLQQTKFELVINLRTARALGLTVPPAMIARADEVIE